MHSKSILPNHASEILQQFIFQKHVSEPVCCSLSKTIKIYMLGRSSIICSYIFFNSGDNGSRKTV